MGLAAPGLGGSGLALHRRGGGLVVAPAQVLAQLDARSNSLLGLTPGIAGMVQPFPTTAAGYIAAMPGTAAVAANVAGAYLCANAGAQLDSLALGPNLAQTAALDSRIAVALAGGGSFAAKLAVELLGGAQYYADAGTAFGNANGSIVTVHGAFRIRPGAAATETWIASKWNGTVGWTLSCSSTYLRATAAGSGTTQRASIAVDPRDGAWHWFILTLDDTGKVVKLFSDLGSATSAAYTGSVTNAGHFSLGYTSASFAGQVAVCYVLNAALTLADGTAFWHHALAGGLAGVTNTYARTNPLRVAVSSAYIGGFGAGQVATAYHPSLPVDAANALLTGEMLNAAMSFLGINSANLPGWTGTNATLTAADGRSGMRDAVQVASTSNGGYASSGTATGLSTKVGDSFCAGSLARRGAADTNAVVSLYLAGSGGGAEEIVCKTLTGTVPTAEATYPDGDGKCPTWYGSAACANAGQTSAVMRLYPQIGAATGTIIFSEAWAMTGTAVPPLAYRATAAGAAVSTGVPSESFTNVGNARYTPAKGALTLPLAGFVNPAGCAPVAVAGSPFATGAGPFGVAVDALGQVWIANYSGATVTCYNAATKSLVGTYATGASPQGVAVDALGQVWIANYSANTVTCYNTRPVLLSLGAEGAKGALIIDYAGNLQLAPLFLSAANLRLRTWDNTPALVGGAAIMCGTLDNLGHTLKVKWNATMGTVQVYDGAVLIGSYAGGAWTPSASDVTPCYVGADSNGASAARAIFAQLQLLNK